MGTLIEDSTRPLSKPIHFRHKTTSPSGHFAPDYAATVCEHDTELVLLHKLSITQLEDCRGAMLRRRSPRCPQGPCECRSLGYKPTHQRRLVLYNGTVVATKSGGCRARRRYGAQGQSGESG